MLFAVFKKNHLIAKIPNKIIIYNSNALNIRNFDGNFREKISFCH